jgi:hypothetical protein
MSQHPPPKKKHKPQAFVPHAIRKKKRGTEISSKLLIARTDSKGSSQSQSKTIKINIAGDQPNKATDFDETNKTAPTAITCKLSDDNEGNEDALANNNHDDDDELDNEPPYMENETESLRLLHASVTPSNMYDPYCPNDYLAYRERKRSEEVRKELQRTALQRLEQQENLRKQIEVKRQKLLESGNFQALVEEETMTSSSRRNEVDGRGGGGVGMGRGRGRGVTNLPAWLVKKQEEQQQNEIKSEASGLDALGADEQFDDGSTR